MLCADQATAETLMEDDLATNLDIVDVVRAGDIP